MINLFIILKTTNQQLKLKTKMSSQIIKASELNVSGLTFSDVKTDKYNKKMVFVNRDGGKKVLIQTPKMFNVFGAKRWHSEGTDVKDDSFAVELSFAGKDMSPELQKFHQVLTDLDNLVKEKAYENRSSWLNKPKISKESIEETMYLPTLKVSTDKNGEVLEYPDRFKIKFDKDRESGKFLSSKKTNSEIMVFDDSKQMVQVNADNIENVMGKGSYLTSVVELVYIIIGAKISLKFKFVQGKLIQNNNEITGNVMLDDEDDISPSMNKLTVKDTVLPQDLDEEEQENEEVAEEASEEIVEVEEESEGEEIFEPVAPAPLPIPEPTKKSRAKKA